MFFHKRLIIRLHDLLHDKLLKTLPIGIEVVQDPIKIRSALLVGDIVDKCRVFDGSVRVDVGLQLHLLLLADCRQFLRRAEDLERVFALLLGLALAAAEKHDKNINYS